MLFRMLVDRMSPPGWTGNLKASLRTVKAARRTLSVGSFGHPVMASFVYDVLHRVLRFPIRVPRIVRQEPGAAVTFFDRLARSRASSCTVSPVSVGDNAIETGVARLAQCQSPRRFAPNDLRCKSRQNRLYCERHHQRCRSRTSDPRSMQRRASGDVMWNADRSSRSLCPAAGKEAAARLSVRDQARPALYPVNH